MRAIAAIGGAARRTLCPYGVRFSIRFLAGRRRRVEADGAVFGDGVELGLPGVGGPDPSAVELGGTLLGRDDVAPRLEGVELAGAEELAQTVVGELEDVTDLQQQE